MEKEKDSEVATVTVEEAPINASGHRQELDRNFTLFSLCGLSISSGNTWIALGGSVTVAIYNGGPPGVIYEFIAASFFYWLIAASLAELASAMPSSGGVYHWASITGGRYGRVCGWFAGWWNFWAWEFALAGSCLVVAAQAVSMYKAFHPEFTTERWHIFLAYLISTWVCCFVVLYMNRALPTLAAADGILVIIGVLITVIVCAVMPSSHGGYATNEFVWRDWQNTTGYGSNGFVFLLGMLNGAFAVGTPDVVSHLAEEVQHPSKNIPIAMFFQFAFGFISAFAYLVAILYSISDLESVLKSAYLFPLASIYRQATNSAGGTLGLLLCAFLPFFIGTVGCVLTVSRMFWTLARDNATPFAGYFGRVHATHRNPFNSVVLCGVINILLGCIYLGTAAGFNAFVSSFVVLTCLSYLAAILPHLLHRRTKIEPGWFWMKGATGFVVNAVACVYIVVFNVIFLFPFSLPTTADTMNYCSLIVGGLSLFMAAFWFWRQRDYSGPKYVPPTSEMLAVDAI